MYLNLDEICEEIEQNYVTENDYFKSLDKNSQFIYQIQNKNNSIYLVEVGKFIKSSNVLINKFDYTPKYKCILVSKLYSHKELDIDLTLCTFDMIKLIINYNNGINLKPIACIKLSFNTFKHVQNKMSILEYRDNNTKLGKKLKGFYTIKFNFKNKYINLGVYKEFLGVDKFIEIMIEHFKSENIMNIINALCLHK